VLDQEIEGKKFDPKKNDGDGSSYRKHIIAEKQVRPNVGTINFSGLEPILAGVSQAISDHHGKVSARKAVAKKSA